MQRELSMGSVRASFSRVLPKSLVSCYRNIGNREVATLELEYNCDYIERDITVVTEVLMYIQVTRAYPGLILEGAK